MVLVLPQQMVEVLMGCSEDDELSAFHQLLPLDRRLLETLRCSTNASHKDKIWHFGSIVLHNIRQARYWAYQHFIWLHIFQFLIVT